MLLATLIFALLHVALGGAKRRYCPLAKLVANSNRTVPVLKTALIGEIHGNLLVKTQKHPLHWSWYYSGTLVSRYLFHHIGILGIDKLYLTVFYNETLYPTPPTVEDLYPSDKHCVSDWFKLGYLDWRPYVYAGSDLSTWPLDSNGKPTRDRAVYKTLKGYNPIYAEIKNQYDWLFVMDLDEELNLVNANFNRSVVDSFPEDWCGPQHPSLITKILQQMLTVAMTAKLDWYPIMMESIKTKNALSASNACSTGQSYCKRCGKCKAVTAFLLPVHLWIHGPRVHRNELPTIRSKYPCHYPPNIKGEPRDGHEERWKAVYNTKYNPPLGGMSVHANGANTPDSFYLHAPRDFHGSLSLELVHARGGAIRELSTDNITRLMAPDNRLVDLFAAYHRCIRQLK